MTISFYDTKYPPKAKICFNFSQEILDNILEKLVMFMKISGAALRLWHCNCPEHHSRNVPQVRQEIVVSTQLVHVERVQDQIIEQMVAVCASSEA